EQLTDWLGAAPGANDEPLLAFREQPTREWIASSVAPAIDIEPVNAKFSIQDGKVTEFKASRNGYKTDSAATIAALNEALRAALADNASSPPRVAIAVQEVPSTITNENVNDLGITELLGTGHS